jgi:hypothetical protein
VSPLPRGGRLGIAEARHPKPAALYSRSARASATVLAAPPRFRFRYADVESALSAELASD